MYTQTYRRQWKNWLAELARKEQEIITIYERAFAEVENQLLSLPSTHEEFIKVKRQMLAELKYTMRQVAKEIEHKIKEFGQYTTEQVLDSQMQALGAFVTSKGLTVPIIPPGMSISHLQEEAFRYWLTFPADGIPLSKRVWRIHKEMAQAIASKVSEGLLIGKAPIEIAQELKGLLKNPEGYGRLVGQVRRLRTLARQARASGDPERARRLFAKAREIEQTIPKVGRGVYRSAIKNALRVARSETTRAQFVTTVLYAKKQDWIIGVRWVLSAGHPMVDICDDLAGVYAKDNVPFPPHPHCLCHLENVIDYRLTGDRPEPFKEPPEYIDVIGKSRITDERLLELRKQMFYQARLRDKLKQSR